MPTVVFSTIQQWETYVDNLIGTNGVGAISGIIGNNAFNGAIKFAKQAPLNWSKATIYSNGGDIFLEDEFSGVVVFSTTTPTSLGWGDNFYNQYVLINTASSAIPFSGDLVYYDLSGNAISSLPANSCVFLFKASNDNWIGINISASGSGGSILPDDLYFAVPVSGGPYINPTGFVITLPLAFKGWKVRLIRNNSPVDYLNQGLGDPYFSSDPTVPNITLSNAAFYQDKFQVEAYKPN